MKKSLKKRTRPNFAQRSFLLVSLSLNTFLLPFSTCWAEKPSVDLSVVDVRRNIPLSDTEPVFKDFYINGGTESGIKKNQVLTLIRKVPVKDSHGTQVLGEMLIPVGQLKVIAVYSKVTVAREVKLFPRVDLPMLEQTGIMIGDQIEL